MDRIALAFDRAAKEDRACFIAYICAGDPDFETSVEICRVLAENRVDIIELGVPFSDPLADGLTNQLAAERALKAGMNHQKFIQLVKNVRTFTQKPIVLYTYFNLVFAQGIEAYLKQIKEAGVDGLLTLDLPPEEAGELLSESREIGIKNIFIVAPTTPPERIEKITKVASGFIYYVSRAGVTGVQDNLAADIGKAIQIIKKRTSLPVVVGFGVSTKSQVKEVSGLADGVVVGSALVNCIAENTNDKKIMLIRFSKKLDDLTSGLD